MSDQYIVSARKYRPQTFNTVVGQEHITTTLKNAIRSQHLAHAYLFCGPRGVGKTTCARILAKTINCENPTADTEACGVCSNCQSFQTSTSFNIFELDAASNNSVDDIRELVNQVRFAPQQGKYKVYIIDEVHMLSSAAFNAFLKTLEEPPPYAIFILATTEKHKIIPTILSRCQIFDFRRITTDDIVTHLKEIAAKEGMTAQEAALHVIAQKSEGCMRDALSMLDRISGFTNGQLSYSATMEHLNMLDADFYFRITDHILSQDVASTLLLLDEVLEKGFEGNVILEGFSEHLRNLLLCKDQRMIKLLDIPHEHRQMYHEKANQSPPSFILSALNALNESELNYKNANNKRLHIEMCLIKLCYVLQATKSDVKKNDEVKNEPVSLQLPVGNAKTETAPVEKKYTPAADISAVKEEAIEAVPAPAVDKEPESNKAVPQLPSNNLPVTYNPSNPSSRRISKTLLKDIDAAINETPEEEVADKKELTDEIVQTVYNQFRQKLQDENRSVHHAQFSGMQAELAGADEIRIVAPDELKEAYAKNQRDILIEYFRKHTGTMVRVTTEVRINPDSISPQEKVLSKQEVFDEMVQKNPELARLKDALNLQIDY